MDFDIVLNTNREGLGHLPPPLMTALSEGYGIVIRTLPLSTPKLKVILKLTFIDVKENG